MNHRDERRPRDRKRNHARPWSRAGARGRDALVRVGLVTVVLAAAWLVGASLAVAENGANGATDTEASASPSSRTASEAAGAVSVQELLRRGGPIMWPLGLCSVIALAFAVERLFNLRTRRVVPPAIVKAVEQALETGQAEESLRACEADRSSAARIFTAGLRHRASSAQTMEHAMEEVGRREVSRLRDNILPLNVIANIAPLLGLLGTVFGMIEAFKVVAGGAGLGKPEALATGIYRALITTAVGLSIAIPALAFYYYFNGRIVRHLRRIDEVGSRLVDRFKAEEAVG